MLQLQGGSKAYGAVRALEPTALGTTSDVGFIVFADSTGQLPDLGTLHHRDNLLAQRPVGERTFLDGLEMDLNILAPDGSTVNLVIDLLVGDVIRAATA